MRRFIVVLALALAAGCNVAQMRATPSVAVSGPSSPLAVASRPRFVYVADVKLERLFVYPYGVSNVPPIAAVDLHAAPQGVASDPAGNVAVAQFFTNSVARFSREAASAIGTVTKGLYRPTGVAFSPAGVMVVGTHHRCTRGNTCEAGAAFFRPGVDRPFRFLPAPLRSDFQGVALAADGSFYGAAQANQGELVADRRGHLDQLLPLVISTGVAFGPASLLLVGDGTALDLVDTVSGRRISRTSLGVGESPRFIGHGADGSLCVPIQSPHGRNYVLVYPVAGAAQPYAITRGLQSPIGCAIGV